MRELSRAECIEFLAEGTRTGKLATVRPDGRPHVAPIWFVVEDDVIVFTTWHTTVKARNLREDPRASLAVDYQHPPYGFVMASGPVEIVDDVDEARRVATLTGGRYMGEDRAEEFGARNGVEGELVMKLRIEELVGREDMAE